MDLATLHGEALSPEGLPLPHCPQIWGYEPNPSRAVPISITMCWLDWRARFHRIRQSRSP
jgi:hypothetical protein